MNKIKYDLKLMKYISLFESLTNAEVKDCINLDDLLVFVVLETEIGKAIGKNGANVKKMINIFNKQIKIIEFSDEVTQFVKNCLFPLQVNEVSQQDNVVIITGADTKTKGQIIGRDKANLISLKSIVKRYFTIDDIKVV
ncbi:MAG: NusA-like transcription termination signal-binding factor [Nanoarchaeota archaeon]